MQVRLANVAQIKIAVLWLKKKGRVDIEKIMISPCPDAFLGERGLSKVILLVSKGTIFEPTKAKYLSFCYIC